MYFLEQRLSFEKGCDLFSKSPLEELKIQAQKIREKLFPNNLVSFIVDANPNYTNICFIKCSFCSFYRSCSDPDAYFKTLDDLRKTFARLVKKGVKTILLQGGVHPKVGLPYLIDIVKMTVNEFPEIHPHFFSAVEIYHAAINSNLSIFKALEQLYEAGLRTIPGAGAEILSERVRKKISPKKLPFFKWIDFHVLAHTIGFKSTATMMFGHLETNEDIVKHLETIREAQDKTKGFLSFIPWSYKTFNNILGPTISISKKTLEDQYFKILAFSRIYLDNFPHISASWFGEGKSVGIKALSYGANDFGGTIFEESVHKESGWDLKTTKEGIISLIKQAGFQPIERNSFYQLSK